jgi:hypothetical protein
MEVTNYVKYRTEKQGSKFGKSVSPAHGREQERGFRESLDYLQGWGLGTFRKGHVIRQQAGSA